MLIFKQVIFPVKFGNYIITARTTKAIEVRAGHSERAARLRKEGDGGERVYKKVRHGRKYSI